MYRCFRVTDLGAAVMMALTASWPLPGAADSASWTASVGIEAGTPGGWVQVRENAIQGTRLDFHQDLGVSHITSQDMTLRYAPDDSDFWAFTLKSYTLDGTAVPMHDVYYNGTTLEAGKGLSATTHLPDYLQLDALRGWRITDSSGADRTLALGLTYTAINFYVDGSVAANSVGHETKEDFVTQELPVLLAAVGVRQPLGRGWSVDSSLDLAYLPWINSLRREGGVVRLTQSRLDLTAELSNAVTRNFSFTLSVYYRYYHQHEQSGEDDNDILLSTRGLRIEAAYRF